MYLLGTGTQRAGKKSRVQVTGQLLALASFQVDLKGEDFSTLNFESYVVTATPANSFDEGILGALATDVKLGGDWDATINMLDPNLAPPGLYPRDDLATVILSVARTENGWTFPYMRVRQATVGSDVKGKVTFEATGMNQGKFNVPTGSFSGTNN